MRPDPEPRAEPGMFWLFRQNRSPPAYFGTHNRLHPHHAGSGFWLDLSVLSWTHRTSGYTWTNDEERCFETFINPEACEGGASDAQVGVHLPQSVADGGEVAAQVLHHVFDAARVFEQVHALCVRVVVHREWTLNCLCKLPVGKTKSVQIREEGGQDLEILEPPQQHGTLRWTPHFIRHNKVNSHRNVCPLNWKKCEFSKEEKCLLLG